MKTALAMVICILVALAYWKPETGEDSVDSSISDRIEAALDEEYDEDPTLAEGDNFIKVLTGDHDRELSEAHIRRYLKKLAKKKRAGVRFWWLKDKKIVAASAFGTDSRHHFVNAYLIGYAPFETEQLWVPHYTISLRLKYQLDRKQYGGLLDVWQSSKQAFLNTRGDCEDHALAIVDWLIEMGVDARVVLGKYKKGGHAWVVVFLDDKVFLLEATDKQKRKHWRHYPLARLTSGYHPKCMFNRDYFWVNTGSTLETDYSGDHWEKRSRYFQFE